MAIRLSYDYVQSYISNEGYKLLSTEYINNESKLDIQCDKNHIFSMIYNCFQQGQRCPICMNKKFSYEHIKSFINKCGYILLSTNYVNNRSKLDIQCDKGHLFKMTFGHIREGRRCPICAKDKQRSNYNDIKNYIESYSYKLLSTDYVNAYTKLNIQCDKGHIYNGNFGNFKQGCRCPICDRQKTTSKPEKEILSIIKQCYIGVIVENDRTQIVNPKTGKMLELDIYLPEINKAIEYNGEYWHNNRYSKWKDTQKIKQCQEKNIELLVITDKEWYSDRHFCLDEINRFIMEV